MKCPFVIGTDGKIHDTNEYGSSMSRAVKLLRHQIRGWQLQPRKYFMSEDAFNDIVSFSSEE
jgi:hypothetical protein